VRRIALSTVPAGSVWRFLSEAVGLTRLLRGEEALPGESWVFSARSIAGAGGGTLGRGGKLGNERVLGDSDGARGEYGEGGTGEAAVKELENAACQEGFTVGAASG
jgi:hypothetical protein